MFRPRVHPVLVLVLTVGTVGNASGAEWPATPFEQSGGRETPDYAETVRWLADLAARSPLLEAGSFGTSPEGRDLLLIVADGEGRFDPRDHASYADRPGRTDHAVVLVQACIHAGESCGKDAGMILLRDLAAGKPEVADLLDHATLVFIPIFNVDGHARFGPYNRINQNGPAEMGWRVTAGNRNLNRDFLKADLPEMRAWLRLFDAWRPDFFIDIHSTDGADYQYPITYSLELNGNLDAGLTAWTTTYRDAVAARMEADGYPLAPYVSYRRWHDPTSGLKDWVAGPRFSQGYVALQNRPGLLVEAHMLKPYEVRVRSTLQLVIHTLRWCGAHAAELRRLVTEADARAAGPELRAQPFPLTFRSTGDSTMIDFLGVEYETVTSAVTGGTWHRYSDRKTVLRVPYFDALEPDRVADLPAAYLVPPAWHEAIARLDAHGIAYTRLTAPREVAVRSWRLTNPQWRQASYEGRHPVTFDAEPVTGTRVFPAGTAVVGMDQRTARVIAHLLEPLGPDSMVQWGYFDPIFERVEYVESYVIEGMIPQLLAEHPEWEAELAAAKAANPAFATDPWAIRYWFYARTPYYDQRVGMYPVGLIDDAATYRALVPSEQ